MSFIPYLLCIITGLGAGIVMAGAIFAFIAVIGIVPRFAQKTKTEKFIKLYEEMIIFGGIFGAFTIFLDFYVPIGKIGAMIYGLSTGIFYGALAISLAEVLNVIPIISRRTGIKRQLNFFVLCLALGKLLGSLLYFFIPGFFNLR